MEDTACIEQPGVVEEVKGHQVFVRIRQVSACAKCHAKTMCSMTEMEDKVIEAHDESLKLSAGDTVYVTMKRSMGNKAVLLGYILPLLILISTLVIMNAMGLKEWMIGVAVAGLLFSYYAVLFFLRNRLKNTFVFTLNKTGSL